MRQKTTYGEMKVHMKRAILFLKEETVLVIALLLAVISMFFVPPDKQYISYIDFHTLAILFSLMCVMAGLQRIGVFQWIAEALLGKVKGSGQLTIILVLLCFFFSMFITNDVSLITFVPFTFIVLKLAGEQQREKLLVPIVVMQTIAANMGSMLTPIGSPHNLYLYGHAGITIGDFMQLMLPYAAFALVLLLVWAWLCGHKNNVPLKISFEQRTDLKGKGKALTAYLILFLLCLLAVVHVVYYVWTVVIVVAVILVLDRRVLLKVDYGLLVTFVGLFVFIGNMGKIPAFCNILQNLMANHVAFTAIAASQVMSNVPASILLSGFTENFRELIVGANLGGLGTLIASMASVISFKYIVREEGRNKGKYFLYFTVANICFLAALVILYILI